ncbi:MULTISPECIES: OprD family outer membrane porin [unclassified Pseudodesulfovibrio]|uniref:OprD family outer membrane porin n=1 Tax=unclassified Pseudodesulfovibrio TaxID=2661612 RepID=UPI000FEBC09B|nr:MULTISPECIES: OprD family outer membrane porin [unclassified Pseudodesulfovibrio]MCJ2164925.1 OprD family porin [Pseudodesulfovibrio sp. S3-i]RWU03712.1 outer membrane porin, OprD family [Pseudodesulfovibrio sp. S3]
MMKNMPMCFSVVVAGLVVLLCALPCLAAEEEAGQSEYGTLTGQTRLYYFTQRNKNTGDGFDDVKESLALGGYLKYETPWLADYVGAGIAGYASVPFVDTFNQRDEGGTGLLTGRNNSIFALGEAYIKLRYDETEGRYWRQRIETPFINGNDSRMLPQTFEAYGVKSNDFDNLELSLYWVDKEKARDTELFKSMTELAGMNGTKGGVVMAGADWQVLEKLPTRFWNYYAPDLDNTFFTQLKYTFGSAEGMEYSVMFQGVDQRSVGDERNGEYNSAEAGLTGTLKFSGFTFDLGGTVVDNSAGIRNSWGTYPFFNNMMSYAFNRAGEKALLVGAGYDFARLGVAGFTANVKAVFGDTPDSGRSASFDRDEYNLNLDYAFSGDLEGLSLLNRWSYQDADEDLGGRDGFQVRLRMQYNFQLM